MTAGHNPGPPGATAAAGPGPAARLMTPELLALDDTTLHRRLTDLRAQAMADAEFYGRWLATVRRRQAGKAGQEAAAKALGVSRATVRRAGKK